LTSPLLVLAGVFLLLALILLRSAITVLRQQHYMSGLSAGAASLLLFACAALASVATVGVLGYRALTYEEVAATVMTQPVTPQHFRATIRFPDERVVMYELAGDAFYIDAHILKWRPALNLLGLHTGYELDRVSGRYDAMAEERSRPRTMFSLARSKPVDLFELARHSSLLTPLVDARYGSASFVSAARAPALFQVLVSSTGLLIRQIELPSPPPE
jgi:hypothetical protein